MQGIKIFLPTELFRELQSAAESMQEPNYGPTHFATDVLASELASRRLSRVAQGRCGARVIETKPIEPVAHRVAWPESA
jgi:hypothetical protein